MRKKDRKRLVAGQSSAFPWRQESVRARRRAILGYFSFFCLGCDSGPLSALGTAPVKTHTRTHTWSGGRIVLRMSQTQQRFNDVVLESRAVKHLLTFYGTSSLSHMTETHTILVII